jgi:hypothetical protein
MEMSPNKIQSFREAHASAALQADFVRANSDSRRLGRFVVSRIPMIITESCQTPSRSLRLRPGDRAGPEPPTRSQAGRLGAQPAYRTAQFYQPTSKQQPSSAHSGESDAGRPQTATLVPGLGGHTPAARAAPWHGDHDNRRDNLAIMIFLAAGGQRRRRRIVNANVDHDRTVRSESRRGRDNHDSHTIIPHSYRGVFNLESARAGAPVFAGR